jgi:hypothetical protein
MNQRRAAAPVWGMPRLARSRDYLCEPWNSYSPRLPRRHSGLGNRDDGSGSGGGRLTRPFAAPQEPECFAVTGPDLE